MCICNALLRLLDALFCLSIAGALWSTQNNDKHIIYVTVLRVNDICAFGKLVHMFKQDKM